MSRNSVGFREGKPLIFSYIKLTFVNLGYSSRKENNKNNDSSTFWNVGSR